MQIKSFGCQTNTNTVVQEKSYVNFKLEREREFSEQVQISELNKQRKI